MNKIDNLYLTEIKDSDKKINKLKGKKSLQKASSYLVKNTQNFEKTTTDFLDFMLNDHFHLADMTKLEEYFRTKGIESFNKYNNKIDEINKKKKLLQELDNQIEHEIITKLVFDPSSIQDAFESEIQNYKKQIEEKEYDLLTYTNEHRRLTKENAVLKGEFKEKLNYSKIFGKQHEKYTFFRNNIEIQFNNHLNLFNDMKNFDSTTKNYYEKELKKKKMIYTKTEYEVIKTKNEITKYKIALEDIKSKIAGKVDSIAKRKKGNEKLFEEHKIHLREYLKDYVKLDRIFDDLKGGDMDILITKFRHGQIQYNGHNLLYTNTNKEILKLNEIYSKLQKELEKKKSLCNWDKLDSLNEMKKTQTDLEEIESAYNFIIKDNKARSENIFIKRNFIKNIINFCVKYDKQISEMIRSYYKQELKLDHLSISNKMNMLLNNNDIQIDDNVSISDECGIHEYIIYKLNPITINNSEKIIFGFNSVEINNLINDVMSEYENNRENIKMLRSSVNNEIKVKTDNLDKKMKDFSMSNKTTLDDLFSNYYQKLYFNKINLEENSNTVMAEMFSNLKSKFYNKICKFTNNSVDNTKSNTTAVINLPKEPLPLAINDRNINRESLIKSLKSHDAIGNTLSKIYIQEDTRVIKDNIIIKENVDKNISTFNSIVDTKTPEKSAYQKLDDSYHSEKAIIVEEKKKKKNYYFFGYNKNKEESLSDVYRRIVDLNSLENRIFKHNNKDQEKLNNNNFSELFYNIKKKIKKSELPSKQKRNSTAPRSSYYEKGRNSLQAPRIDMRSSLLNKNSDSKILKNNNKKSSISKGIRNKEEKDKSDRNKSNIVDNERLINTTNNWNNLNYDTNYTSKYGKNFPSLFNRTIGFSFENNNSNIKTGKNIK